MLQLRNSTIEATVANHGDSMVIKKVFIFLIVSVLMLSTGKAQQIFIGGSLGVNSSGGKSTHYGNTEDLPSNFSLLFAPMAGYYINDYFAVGLKVNLNNSMSKQYVPAFEDDVKSSQTQWGVAAFSRYNIWELGKFSLTLEGSLGMSKMYPKTTIKTETTKGFQESTFSVNVVPLLSYSLTDRLDIQSQLNFLNLGFITRTRRDDDKFILKETRNSFNFGVNNSWQPFNLWVGFIFKL